MPKGYPKTDVLCFEYPDEVPKDVKIDWDIMTSKTLESPLRRILEPLGWQWEEFDPSLTTLKKWGLI